MDGCRFLPLLAAYDKNDHAQSVLSLMSVFHRPVHKMASSGLMHVYYEVISNGLMQVSHDVLSSGPMRVSR